MKLKLLNRYSYIQILLFAISLRLILFLFFSLFPIYHQKFGYVSPLSYQVFADLDFYLNFKLIFEFSLSNLQDFLDTYKKLFYLQFDQIDERYPGVFFSIFRIQRLRYPFL